MVTPSHDNERHRLLSGWCDGALTDVEINRLDELVRTDPGFRDFYLKYMDQHAALATAVLPIGDVRLTVQCPEAACDEPNGRGHTVRAGSGFQDQRARQFSRVPGPSRRWVVVAAALVLGGTIARQWPTGRSGPASVVGPPTAGDPPRLGLARGFAVVVQLAAAEVGAWSGETAVGRRPAGGRSPRPPLGANDVGTA